MPLDCSPQGWMAALPQAGMGAADPRGALRLPRNSRHLYSEPVHGVAFHEI
jgi:hypothetical protein